MIFRYPLKEKYNAINLDVDAQNLRIFVSPTDGLVNLYADVKPKNKSAERYFIVAKTGESYNGEYVGMCSINSMVFHVYEDVNGQSISNFKYRQRPEESCMVFYYPEHGDGKLVERVLFDYEFTNDSIFGLDQTRNLEERQFKLDKIFDGGLQYDKRVR